MDPSSDKTDSRRDWAAGLEFSSLELEPRSELDVGA